MSPQCLPMKMQMIGDGQEVTLAASSTDWGCGQVKAGGSEGQPGLLETEKKEKKKLFQKILQDQASYRTF